MALLHGWLTVMPPSDWVTQPNVCPPPHPSYGQCHAQWLMLLPLLSIYCHILHHHQWKDRFEPCSLMTAFQSTLWNIINSSFYDPIFENNLLSFHDLHKIQAKGVLSLSSCCKPVVYCLVKTPEESFFSYMQPLFCKLFPPTSRLRNEIDKI